MKKEINRDIMAFVNHLIAEFPQIRNTVKKDLLYYFGTSDCEWNDIHCTPNMGELLHLPINQRIVIMNCILNNTKNADVDTCVKIITELRGLFQTPGCLIKFASIYYALVAYGAPSCFECSHDNLFHILLCYCDDYDPTKNISIFGEYDKDVLLSIPEFLLIKRFGFFDQISDNYKKMVANDFDGEKIPTPIPFNYPLITWEEAKSAHPFYSYSTYEITVRLTLSSR